MYPARCSETRAFHKKIWWDLVRPSKEKVGSDRVKAKEEVKEDNNVQRLFDFLAADDKHDDYGEFDLDNACVDNDKYRWRSVCCEQHHG